MNDTASQRTDQHRELPGLTGLRGLAALLVFIYHLPWEAGVRQQTGWGGAWWQRLSDGMDAGVALFFVLSGFLLGLPFWLELEPGGRAVSLPRYALRRMARILPGYWLALVIFQLPNDRTWTAQGLGAFGASWLGLDGWLHRGWEFRIHQVLWTICVELMFYLALPFLFRLVARLPAVAGGLWRVLGMAVLCAGLGPVYSAVAGAVAPRVPEFFLGGGVASDAIARSPVFYLAWFGTGTVAAWVWIKTDRLAGRRALWETLGWLSLAGAVWLMSRAGDAGWRVWFPQNISGWPLGALVWALAVLAVPRSVGLRWIFEHRFFRLLGLWSFGIYLWHMPVIKAVSRGLLDDVLRGPALLVVAGAVSLGVTCLLAWAMHVIVEQPCMAWSREQQSFRAAWESLRARWLAGTKE